MTTTATDSVSMSTLLAALGREATARVRRAIRPFGLGAQEFHVLEQLRLLGQRSQAELADALGIDRSNLAALVAELTDRGLVERSRDDVDRRRYVLRLSRDGEELLRRVEVAVAAAEEDVLGPLEPEQRAHLHALLRRLADGVELCPAPGGE